MLLESTSYVNVRMVATNMHNFQRETLAGSRLFLLVEEAVVSSASLRTICDVCCGPTIQHKSDQSTSWLLVRFPCLLISLQLILSVSTGTHYILIFTALVNSWPHPQWAFSSSVQGMRWCPGENPHV